MSAIPKGPAVCPEPAARSISMMVWRMALAFASSARMSESLRAIGFIIERVVGGLEVLGPKECRAGDKARSAGEDKSTRVLELYSPIDLERQKRIPSTQALDEIHGALA